MAKLPPWSMEAFHWWRFGLSQTARSVIVSRLVHRGNNIILMGQHECLLFIIYSFISLDIDVDKSVWDEGGLRVLPHIAVGIFGSPELNDRQQWPLQFTTAQLILSSPIGYTQPFKDEVQCAKSDVAMVSAAVLVSNVSSHSVFLTAKSKW